MTLSEFGATEARWKADKVCNVTTYLPGDGRDAEDARRPEPLVTTCVATARDAKAFGPMVRLEAERRGLRQAEVVIGRGDGGNWLDPIFDGRFQLHARIIDWTSASSLRV